MQPSARAATRAPITSTLLLAGMGVGLVAVAQVADLVTFAMLVRRFGIAGEANPLAVALYDLGGLGAVALAKVIVIGIIGVVSGWLALHERRLASIVMLVSILGGIAGAASNLIAL